MSPSQGLRGLFRLDSAPLDHADAAAMDLRLLGPVAAKIEGGVCETTHTLDRSDEGRRTTVLAGMLSEAGRLAEQLRLPADTRSAQIARAALDRFGSDAPLQMLGEWTLVDWSPEGRLTLMSSAERRVRLFYAASGARCAISTDLLQLSRLPWVGREIDAAGLLFHAGRAALREQAGATTLLERVRQVRAGETVVVTARGTTSARVDPLVPQPAWRGSFEEACEAATALVRTILRERLSHGEPAALMLSGGLDSSLLAWAAAAEVASGQGLHLLTSAAPPGSGLPDESAYADIVADALGLACARVFPPAEADIYRPPEWMLRAANGPLLSNRHALASAFQAAAVAAGATTVIDGVYGEFSVTGYSPLPTLRGRIGRLLRRPRVVGTLPLADDPGSAFHLRLSAQRLARLPEAVQEAVARPVAERRRVQRKHWGYPQGTPRILDHPAELHPGALRISYPYRDVRLLRLFAGFPLSFFRRDGFDRAVVRRMLEGELPDSIRLRRRGMPASPDHLTRLQRQAPEARARIAAFRRAGVDEWLDLDWLDGALARVAASGPADVADANLVQITAMNAEYLTWWREAR